MFRVLRRDSLTSSRQGSGSDAAARHPDHPAGWGPGRGPGPKGPLSVPVSSSQFQSVPVNHRCSPGVYSVSGP
eukprot:5219312-Amphidinium_carterae.1